MWLFSFRYGIPEPFLSNALISIAVSIPESFPLPDPSKQPNAAKSWKPCFQCIRVYRPEGVQSHVEVAPKTLLSFLSRFHMVYVINNCSHVHHFVGVSQVDPSNIKGHAVCVTNFAPCHELWPPPSSICSCEAGTFWFSLPLGAVPYWQCGSDGTVAVVMVKMEIIVENMTGLRGGSIMFSMEQ